ncbi:MAG: helix-turn-helix transcriptional regulator [Bacteroidia bacterium]
MKLWIITLMCLCGSVVALSGKEGPPPSDKMVALLAEEERNSEKHLSSPPYLLTKPEPKRSSNTLLPIATLAFLSLLGVSAYWVGRKKKAVAATEQKEVDAAPVFANVPSPSEVVVREEVIIDKRFMEQVEHLFQKQLRDPLFNAEALCLAMNMSKSQFYRKFQESFHQSPGKYIREKRLETAHFMLSNEEGNVSEVAYAVGFNNLSYFAKCFRQQYGVPPSQVA